MRIVALAFALALGSGCQTGAAVGASCTTASDCASPLTCAFGRCRAECRQHRDCPVGARCLLDVSGLGRCALLDDPDCRRAGSTCPAALACIGGECVNACTAVSQCPPDSTCAPDPLSGLAACVPMPAAIGDAGVDASVDADVPLDASCTPTTPPCDPVVQLGVGEEVACARTLGGAVWCWGNESRAGTATGAALCDGDENCVREPHRVRSDRGAGIVDLAGAEVLSTSQAVSCVLVEGDVLCWGSNINVNLGTAGLGQVARPVLLEPAGAPTPHDFTEVAVLGIAAIGARATSPWYGWGDDTASTYGATVDSGVPDGGYVVHALAVPAMPVVGATHLVAGLDNTCAIVGGDAWCWGGDDDGQSTGGTPGLRAPPAAVLGVPTGVTALAVGRGHGCAVAAGAVYCWGNRGAIGVISDPPGCVPGGDRLACPATRVALDPTHTWVALATASYANAECAIDDQGGVACWGEDDGGLFPDTSGDHLPHAQPLPPVTAIGLAPDFACAIVDGDVWCWGSNALGQLGRGIADGTFHDDGAAPVLWPR